MRPKVKQHQAELPGLPEMNDLGKAATDYLNKRDALQRAKDECDSAKKLLAIEFQSAGKRSLRVSGYTLNYMHKDSDTIQVKKDAGN